MSLECGICERDLRAPCPYGDDCPRSIVQRIAQGIRDEERDRCLAIVEGRNIPGHSVVGPVIANILDRIRDVQHDDREP